MKKLFLILALILFVLGINNSVWASTAASLDLAKLKPLAQKAATGDNDAWSELYAIFAQSQVANKQDFETALAISQKSGIGMSLLFSIPNMQSWLETKANAGDAAMQFFLGDVYYRGDGLDQDPAKALAWLAKAAAQNYVPAEIALADFCQFSEPERALALYKKAADSGSARAQYYLGVLYNRFSFIEANDFGINLERDVPKAIYWWQKAAEHGYSDALVELAMLYTLGEDVKKDHAKAFAYAHKAAELNHAYAQGMVAEFYMDDDDDGIEQNYIMAYMWFSLSVSSEYNYMAETSQSKMQELETLMTSSELATARDLADTWLKNWRTNTNR